MPLEITYLGQSGLLLSDGRHTLCIDPFLTGNDRAVHAPGDIKCTHVAFTHGHFDHFNDDGIQIARDHNATVLAPFEVAGACKKQGIKEERVLAGNPGGRFDLPFGHIAFTPAVHSSSDSEGNYMGCACGLVIEMAGVVVYHAGDTGLFGDMELIGRIAKPKIAVLPIGGVFTMTPKLASLAAEMVKAPYAIPTHYGTFPSQVQDADDFKPQGVEVKILTPGQTWTVE